MFGTTPDNTPDLLDDKRVERLSENPFLLDEAKNFLEIHSSEDGFAVELLLAAKRHFEDIANHFIDRQKRVVIFDRFSSRYKVPATPNVELVSASAYENGSELGITDASDWFVHPSYPPQIWRKGDLPQQSVDSYRFEYEAGYNSTEMIDDQVKLVVRKIVRDLYDFRTSQVDSGLAKAELKTDWDKMIENAELDVEIDQQPPFAFNDTDEYLSRRRNQVFFDNRFI